MADGGTRTAAVTGGFVALCLAVQKLLDEGRIVDSPVVRQVAAVSVGIVKGAPTLDLDYALDSRAEADVNVVMTRQDGEMAYAEAVSYTHLASPIASAGARCWARCGTRALSPGTTTST